MIVGTSALIVILTGGPEREEAALARSAYRDYGRGSGHRAKLNFGDCFAYALAASAAEPLLFNGDDFVHTDIRPAT